MGDGVVEWGMGDHSWEVGRRSEPTARVLSTPEYMGRIDEMSNRFLETFDGPLCRHVGRDVHQMYVHRVAVPLERLDQRGRVRRVPDRRVDEVGPRRDDLLQGGQPDGSRLGVERAGPESVLVDAARVVLLRPVGVEEDGAVGLDQGIGCRGRLAGAGEPEHEVGPPLEAGRAFGE